MRLRRRSTKDNELTEVGVCSCELALKSRRPRPLTQLPTALSWRRLAGLGSMYTDADIAFVLQKVAPGREIRGRLGDAFRDDREIRDGMLSSDQLAKALLDRDDAFLLVSPLLFFSILVARVRRDLSEQSFTIESSDRHLTAVFDVRGVQDFISRPAVFDYLILLLVSFVRARVLTMLVTGDDGRQRVARFNTFDLHGLIRAAAGADDERERFSSCQRIADLCLFTVGIFPEQTRWSPARHATDWSGYGERFYRMAARHRSAHDLRVNVVLSELASNFNLATKPLNVLSDRYLGQLRRSMFPV